MKLGPKPPPDEPLELPIDALLRSNFLAFAEKCFYTEYPGSIFEPNWHHEHIAYMLTKSMTDPDYSRLLFNQPPRSMKSELINAIFTAWLLGHDPSCKIMSVTGIGSTASPVFFLSGLPKAGERAAMNAEAKRMTPIQRTMPVRMPGEPENAPHIAIAARISAAKAQRLRCVPI